ncbi:FAD-dependent oxidoreductase [Euzebya tangerina]|uniref:FAD-dependent oxidoreductase n=1 Tax=Euzebya tangerina TaxID=591198 RepID=UPI000E316759|nr:FAD-dependent oxidoreductase [Euzebya tangerina]
MSRISSEHPVVVIGGGPIGLAAGAHLRGRGLPFLVLEAGASAAAGVRSWGHVRLFSQWNELVDDAAAKLLAPTGWSAPAGEVYPTGSEWAEAYLQPLADGLGDALKTSYRVVAVSRQGADVMKDTRRSERPFVLVVDTPSGQFRQLAGAVIDASGTILTPSPLGADGLPAIGEHDHAERVTSGVPDTGSAEIRSRHTGAHTLVVGAGHTAMNALLNLAALRQGDPSTRIGWVIRGGSADANYGGGSADQLPARGALGLRVQALVEDGVIEVHTGFETAEVTDGPDGRMTITATGGRTIPDVDHIVRATGYRPDLSLTAELRLDLDPGVQAPRALAPLIDPNVHSCGTVPPHGEAELAHPEPGFYTVGMKSYGRAPTFLAVTGFEQVRSVVAWLDGDDEAAREVRLVLPETGVCGGSGLNEELTDGLPLVEQTAGGGCC